MRPSEGQVDEVADFESCGEGDIKTKELAGKEFSKSNN